MDSDHCIFLLRKHSSVCRHFAERSNEQAYISIITVGELLFGAYWSSRPDENLATTNQFIDSVVSLPVARSTMDRFGRIKADLFRRGRKIQDFDIVIAATALEHDLTLVTHNTNHYERIPGLRLEDWCEDASPQAQ